jgi:hypothetical protein
MRFAIVIPRSTRPRSIDTGKNQSEKKRNRATDSPRAGKIYTKGTHNPPVWVDNGMTPRTIPVIRILFLKLK